VLCVECLFLPKFKGKEIVSIDKAYKTKMQDYKNELKQYDALNKKVMTFLKDYEKSFENCKSDYDVLMNTVKEVFTSAAKLMAKLSNKITDSLNSTFENNKSKYEKSTIQLNNLIQNCSSIVQHEFLDAESFLYKVAERRICLQTLEDLLKSKTLSLDHFDKSCFDKEFDDFSKSFKKLSVDKMHQANTSIPSPSVFYNGSISSRGGQEKSRSTLPTAGISDRSVAHNNSALLKTITANAASPTVTANHSVNLNSNSSSTNQPLQLHPSQPAQTAPTPPPQPSQSPAQPPVQPPAPTVSPNPPQPPSSKPKKENSKKSFTRSKSPIFKTDMLALKRREAKTAKLIEGGNINSNDVSRDVSMRGEVTTRGVAGAAVTHEEKIEKTERPGDRSVTRKLGSANDLSHGGLSSRTQTLGNLKNISGTSHMLQERRNNLSNIDTSSKDTSSYNTFGKQNPSKKQLTDFSRMNTESNISKIGKENNPKLFPIDQHQPKSTNINPSTTSFFQAAQDKVQINYLDDQRLSNLSDSYHGSLALKSSNLKIGQSILQSSGLPEGSPRVEQQAINNWHRRRESDVDLQSRLVDSSKKLQAVSSAKQKETALGGTHIESMSITIVSNQQKAGRDVHWSPNATSEVGSELAVYEEAYRTFEEPNRIERLDFGETGKFSAQDVVRQESSSEASVDRRPSTLKRPTINGAGLAANVHQFEFEERVTSPEKDFESIRSRNSLRPVINQVAMTNVGSLSQRYTTFSDKPASFSKLNIVSDKNSTDFVSGKILAVGGTGEKEQLAIEEFDAENNSWKVVMQSSRQGTESRSKFGCVLVNGKNVLIFGGKTSNKRYSDSVLVNIENGSLSEGPLNLFEAKSGFGTCVLHSRVHLMLDKLYICGGNNGQDILQSFECYDLSTNICTRLPDMHLARDELALVAMNGEIYAIGGGGKDGQTLRSVEKYSFSKKKWEFAPDLLIERRAHAAIVFNNRIFVTGGFDGERYLCSCER
jgi:hypothetical protein